MTQVSTQEELRAALLARETEIQVTADFDVGVQQNITYPLLLRSDPSAAVHTISKTAGFSGSLLRVSGGGALTLENLVLDGSAAGTYLENPANRTLVQAAGGSVHLSSGAMLQNNSSYQEGGGLYLSGDASYVNTLLMDGDAAIRGCNSRTSGGGLTAALRNNGDSVRLEGSAVIEENTAANGAGVYLRSYLAEVGGTLSIGGRVQIRGNRASSNGGGVYCSSFSTGGSASLSLTVEGEVEIASNQAASGGGLYFYSANMGDRLALTGSIRIAENTVTGNGGGIYSAEGTGRIVIRGGSQITENSAASGGGIYHAGEWVLALEDVTIDQNTAPTGQGVYNDGPLELGPTSVIPDGLYLPDQAAVPTIVGHLSRDSVVQLERSDYMTPDQTGTPIVAAQSDLELVGEDAVVFRIPPTGFAGWWFRVSDDRRQILLTPVEYHLYYENTLGVGNPNPDLYTSLTPTIELLPLTDTPGNRFLGWYAAAEGGDRVTQIPRGSTGDKTLYARWQTVEYTVTYNGNDAGGPAAENVPPSQQVRGGESALLSDERPTRAGYAFLGWNTDPGGAGAVYLPGGTVPSVLADTGLYAQWGPLPPAVHMLTYHGNDAGGPAAQDVPGPVLVLDGQGATLASTVPTRAGFVFAGWNTDPIGAGAAYPPGGTVPDVRADMELYAQWVPLPPPAYNRLTYRGNDAGGPPACRVPCDQQVPAGQYVRIARCAPCRACYCFTGWSTDPCGRGPVVRPGQTIGPVTEDISLYAQWRRLPPPKIRYVCRTEPD